ncbi:hypothetical protein [Bacillus sp. 1P02SD]|uniref:hypothetical protein n=1 Tax=Bacillus sp. 1P02SD TaxID=3132264 RepID=UPI0039A22A86
MNLLDTIEKWLLYIGIVTCCLGLIFILGFSEHIVFKYASGLGLMMISISVILSAFSKKQGDN